MRLLIKRRPRLHAVLSTAVWVWSCCKHGLAVRCHGLSVAQRGSARRHHARCLFSASSTLLTQQAVWVRGCCKDGPAARCHGLSVAQRDAALRAAQAKSAQHRRQSGSGAAAIMVLLRAAMASARLSMMPPLPPGKRPLRAPATSVGGGLPAAAAGVAAAGLEAGLEVTLAASGLSCAAGLSCALSAVPLSTIPSGPSWAAGVSRTPSTVPFELLHGLTGAAGACACVAFAVGGVVARRAISGP